MGGSYASTRVLGTYGDFNAASSELPQAVRDYRAAGLPWAAVDIERHVAPEDNAAPLVRRALGGKEAIEAALAEAGVSAVEIVEETPRLEGEGRRGMARVLEFVRRSDVDTLLVASFNALFTDRLSVDRWRREMMAKYGVRALELG